MKSHGTTKAGFRKATSAIGIAVLTVAASTLGTTPAWGAASGPSGTVKIITWINPPTVAAFKKIDRGVRKGVPQHHGAARDGCQRDDRVRQPPHHNCRCRQR